MAWSLLFAAVVLGCYLAFAPPVSGDDDASEIGMALATGGVIHPTGYPVYTLLGHAFVVLVHRLGATFPHAANAWAALGGGVAIFLLHRLSLRILPAQAAPSRALRFAFTAGPVLVFAFNPVWMAECTVVEVHSWQLAWVCGLSLAFAGLVEDLAGREPPRGFTLRMVGWGLLCGLGGTNHTTAMFFAGGTTIALGFALVRARRFSPWIPLAWVATGVIPLLSYVTLHFRAQHPAAAEVWPILEPGWSSVLAHVTARAYRAYLGHWAPDADQATWFALYIAAWLGLGLALLAAQSWMARGARRTFLAGLLGSALAQTLFTFRYGVPDPDAYFLPPLAVGMLAFAPVLAWLFARLRASRGGLALTFGTVSLMLTAYLWVNGVFMIARRDLIVRSDAWLVDLWKSVPADDGIVLWPGDMYVRLKEYQRYLGIKPRLFVQSTTMLTFARPRREFQQRFGFDPLATQDAQHFAEPLKPQYAVGDSRNPVEQHGVALIHECIAAHARVPVIVFAPPEPPRILPVPAADSTRSR